MDDRWTLGTHVPDETAGQLPITTRHRELGGGAGRQAQDRACLQRQQYSLKRQGSGEENDADDVVLWRGRRDESRHGANDRYRFASWAR